MKQINSREQVTFIFEKEARVLADAKQLLAREDLSCEILKEAYEVLAQRYEKLLHLMEKVTRISDNNQRKIFKANQDK